MSKSIASRFAALRGSGLVEVCDTWSCAQ